MKLAILRAPAYRQARMSILVIYKILGVLLERTLGFFRQECARNYDELEHEKPA
jgi:hypothetical protein